MSFIEVNLLVIKAFPFKESFVLEGDFFGSFASDITPIGAFRADLELNKTVQGYQVDLDISGEIEAECARSNELFPYKVQLHERVFFRLSDYSEDTGEDLILLNRNSETLELDQVVYDKIALSIPLRLVHPRFEAEDDEDEVKVLYSTENESESKPVNEEVEIDPRWAALFKLKKDSN